MFAANGVLRSGVRCIVVDDPGSSAVVVSALSAAGWRHDPCRRAGLAHLGEHLLAVGGGPRTSGIESVGGKLHATTHPDHLQFVLSAPVEFWRECVDDQLSRLDGSFAVSEDEFDYQRQAVVQEIRALSASQSPWPAMTEALFDDPALGHEGFGVESEIEREELESCTRFLRHTVRADRGVLVCAVDVATVGGASVVFDALEAHDARTGDTGPLARDVFPDAGGAPRTVAGPGVVHRWFGWAIPGLQRDRTRHAQLYALWSVLHARSVGARFGRSGFGFAADRETLALAPGSVEIGEITGQPITADEFDRARASLVELTARLPGDPTAVGRAVMLGGGADLVDSVRATAADLTPDMLDGARRWLHTTEAAVVIPSTEAVDSTARFSRDQAPRGRPPAVLRATVPGALVSGALVSGALVSGATVPGAKNSPVRTGAGRRTTAVGKFVAALDRASPMHVRIRTAVPLQHENGPWSQVPDLGGHRYAAAVADADMAVMLLDSVADISELAIVGDAVSKVAASVDVPGPRYDPGPSISLEEAAAQWLALGALNGIHSVARGEAPTVTLLRLGEPSGHRLVVVGAIGADTLREAVERWTAGELAATRAFCSGQAAVASGSAAESANLVLTLLSTGTRVENADSDVVATFASALNAVESSVVRAAAHQLIDRSNVTNVRATA